MKACKHLDYNEKMYSQCEIRDCRPGYPDVRYWFRHVVPYKEAPRNVQFCKLRGRINSVFDCYMKPGPANCYESD